MLSKRRRASSVASKDDEVADDSTPEQSPVLSARKRKRLDPSELCQQLYDSIRTIKKEDGSMLCDTFIRAPKRRQEPSYYEVVANPIDLLRVQQKLKTDSYDDIEELTADFELLINNAKAFYKSDSAEYQDACTLLEMFNTKKAILLESLGLDDEPRIKRIGRQPRRSTANESETSETSNKLDDDSDPYEELFATIMTSTDPTQDNRPLNSEFQLLPSKKIYPEYYDVVDHPIDLRLIATKIQTNAYANLSEMEKDLLQMVKNACIFNEPGSQIYKDAKTFKKIFTTKKIEIESGKYKSIVKKRGIPISATIAALKDEPESSADEDDDNEKKEDSPMWQLFDHLFNSASASDHPNATGAPLGQSLWKLPHRRFRPEYYELIKKPISMSQIQAKLKKGEYSNISDFTADIYLMLDNAKKAFPTTHRVHKDALKMLKIMNTKIVDNSIELDNSDSDSQEMQNPETLPKKKGRPRLSTNIIPSTTTAVGTSITTSSNQFNLSPKTRPINLAVKKKLLSLQKFLTEFTIANRRPMSLFMEKPSKKLYPDYYDIIQYPIDMNTIENYIRSDKYSTLDDVVGDYRLMFSNCRKYNEEGSTIYEDANVLEKALSDKLKEFSGFVDKKSTVKILKTTRKYISPLDSKLWQFYDTIRDYNEPKGNRQLSVIFLKLPSKSDYPDYFDIIKNPIDMEKVAQKLKQQMYESVDELSADFLLMFENACKYNEPDSQIYKDALVLQQLCIQTKQSLRDNDESVPDVPLAVQEMLLSLFTALYNHQDEEGRCYSDSLAELPEYDDIDSTNKIRGISLDLIKRRLDKGMYKRLDIFQEDLFLCLERARKLSRTDSQVFEDSIELQSFFIKKRDELCKDTLSSPALSYTALHLSAAVEAVRQSKLLQEEQDQDEIDTAATQGESMIIDQKVFSPGDFVYYESTDNKIPGIAYIERLWTDNNNIKMMFGNIFLRPYETYHVTTRKFLEQEVFKSDQRQPIPLSKILNKCYVMSVKDYIKFKPEGYADKDIYVCESRYSMKARSFKKIKYWALVRDNDPVKFIPRENILELKRIMSVFKERVEKHKGELAELQLREAMIEKEKPNVICLIGGGDEGNTYYEQYNTICSGVVKTGDYVYVASQSGKQSIAQIHNIWETPDGTKSYFQGPWLLAPTELPTNINKNIYRQELFLSTVQETNPIIAIVGRCTVLEYNEYTLSRPTEIAESDVYICENIYDEMKKNIKRFPSGNGLKKFNHSQLVTLDEIFHFKRPVKPLRMNIHSSSEINKVLDFKVESNDGLGVLEDSLDGEPTSVHSDIMSCSSPVLSMISTPISSKKALKQQNKYPKVTGYILYSSDIRRSVCKKNPDSTFGDISRIVGNEWKTLPANVKQCWEDKAGKLNEENAKLLLEANCASPTPSQLFECLWDQCDFQFEDPTDFIEHCIADRTGHIYTHYADKGNDAEYHCLWKNCIRLKKKIAAPFPHMRKLIKHVREVHLSKGGKIVQAPDRNKNFVSRKNIQNQSQNMLTPINSQLSPQTVGNVQQHQFIAAPPPEPMFVTVPPRPQRVLHSEAYIKYIEGLQNNSGQISPWEKTIRASKATVPPTDISKLPTHWLGNIAKDKSEDVVNSLWHLRNFMMNDALQIKRNYF